MLPSEVRTGLANALKALPGLHVYEFVPDVLVAPAVIVGQLSMTYDKAMAGGLHYADIDVALVVKQISSRAGQKALDGYLASTGSDSIKSAIETDPTLGDVVSTTNVISATPGTYENAGTTYLAYRYKLEIFG